MSWFRITSHELIILKITLLLFKISIYFIFVKKIKKKKTTHTHFVFIFVVLKNEIVIWKYSIFKWVIRHLPWYNFKRWAFNYFEFLFKVRWTSNSVREIVGAQPNFRPNFCSVSAIYSRLVPNITNQFIPCCRTQFKRSAYSKTLFFFLLLSGLLKKKNNKIIEYLFIF